MMRIACALLLAVVLASVACGSSSPASPTGSGSAIQFRLDANSCGALFGGSSLTFTFFVDGIQVGVASLGVNQTTTPFPVGAGSHLASASVSNTSVRWSNLSFTVAQGQTFTYLLLC